MTEPGRPQRLPAPILIEAYHPAWPSIAARLAAGITEACGGAVLRVEHIGSTSVPGLAAKPVIDLMPVLARFEGGERCVAPMQARGYEYRGEYGILGRHYFRGQDATTGLQIHVHMLVEGSRECRNHLLFRDYLRAHPHEAEAYAALKHSLALQHRDNRERYTDAKAPWVQAALERAAVYAPTPNPPPSRGRVGGGGIQVARTHEKHGVSRPSALLRAQDERVVVDSRPVRPWR